MTTARLSLWLAMSLAGPATGSAQSFTRTEYHAYLPPPGKPTEQTAASRDFRLFKGHDGALPSGTPGVSPQREQRLLALAARFSPILIPTNFSVPRDFEDVLAFSYDSLTRSVHCRGSFELVVDVWKSTLSSWEPDRESSRLVPLRTIRSPVCPAEDSLAPASQAAETVSVVADTMIRKLLLALGPKPAPRKPNTGWEGLRPLTEEDSTRLQYTPDRRVRHNADTVLYFDMPGSERASWRDAYTQLRNLRSRIYFHPFVYEHASVTSANRYEIVLQYWFFYPLNDGVNNHEGDWEHLNVSISTRERLENLSGDARLLTAEEVRGILDSAGSSGLDDLAISAVDYYFHNFVATLDYKEAHEHDGVTGTPAYTKEVAERFGAERSGVPKEENRFYNDVLAREVRNRISEGPDLLRTHPVSFIGGMSVSPTQILALPGPKNENSHGSYPFTGVWRGVGPFLAREKMRGSFDASKVVRMGSVPPGRDTLDMVHYIDPCYQPGSVRPCMTGDSAPIVLLPDWEEMVDMIYSAEGSPELRRQWAWFALPIRWGYPITGSPGARLVQGFDFGNAAPIGPAFNAAWNRIGSGPGYVRYPLYPLTRGLQQTPWDNIYNVLGVGNVVPTVATLLPPITIAATLVTGLVHGRRRVYAPVRPGMRNVEIGYARSWGGGGTGFARRLPRIGQFAGQPPDTPVPGETRENFVRDPDAGHHVELLMHWGRHWGTETIYSWRTSRVSYEGRLENGSFADVIGRLDKKELLGVIRLGTLVPLGFQGQFVLRLGYGWTWYTIQDIHLEGTGGPAFVATTAPSTRDGPHLFPNTVLGGAAFESTFQLFRRPRSTIGARVAATAYSTKGVGGRTDLTAGLMVGF